MKDLNDVIIGLEIHCQLTSLKSKLFCSCSADYRGREPNSLVCPVCLGLPGSLPVPNRRAVELAIIVALALKSEVSERSLFFRKNYYYPDMPKNFQISQYDKSGGVPIALGGCVSFHLNDEELNTDISRIQIEEDPAKLVYPSTIDNSPYTLVDYNRAGVTLLEIVTKPVLRSPKEARAFLQKLRSILEHLGVSDSAVVFGPPKRVEGNLVIVIPCFHGSQFKTSRISYSVKAGAVLSIFLFVFKFK